MAASKAHDTSANGQSGDYLVLGGRDGSGAVRDGAWLGNPPTAGRCPQGSALTRSWHPTCTPCPPGSRGDAEPVSTRLHSRLPYCELCPAGARQCRRHRTPLR